MNTEMVLVISIQAGKDSHVRDRFDGFQACQRTSTAAFVSGVFAVNFNVDPLLRGWRSLELIASVLVESEDRSSLRLPLWSVGRGTPVNFELEGREHADPDALATILSHMR